MADEEAQGEAIPHIDTTEVIGDGWYPDEPRVLATWNVDTTTGNETPIRINHNGLRGELKPNTMTLMPESTAQMLIEGGYDVEIQFNAIVNEGVDEEIEAAVAALEAARARGAELAKMTVDALTAALPDCDLNALRYALEAEEANRKRASAIAAIEAAIDAHPDQIAALAAAAGQDTQNEGSNQTS